MWWPGLEPTSKLWNCGRLPSSLSFHICKMETQTVYPSSRIARTPLNDIGENQGSQWPCPALIHCSRSLAEGQDEALDAARLRTFAWFFPPWQHLSPSHHTTDDHFLSHRTVHLLCIIVTGYAYYSVFFLN